MKIESVHEDGAELEQEVDDDINDFEVWFTKHIDDAPLMKGEKAIIKTYLNYHLVAKKEDPGAKKKSP